MIKRIVIKKGKYAGQRVRLYCSCTGNDWIMDRTMRKADVLGTGLRCKKCYMYYWTFSKPKGE